MLNRNINVWLTINMVAFTISGSASAFAQCDLSGSPNTTLKTPLLYGAPSTPPMQMAPEGQPPPIGDGNVPAPVVPGHQGPPTLLPYNNVTPANHINYGAVAVPFNPASQTPPGVLGPGTWAPPPPETPGYDPGMVHAPLDFYEPPVNVVHINPGGGIYGSAPTQRWGGQTTQDFGLYKYDGKRAYDFGQQLRGQTSEDGPCPAFGAVPTQDLHGRRRPWRNNGFPSTQTIAPF